jgi:hypothetical protein
MTYLLFTVALSLSALAAYYAVMGLIAIFAAAVVPIALMGSLLEASKLVVASWLYRNWKEIPGLMKSYFTIALVVLMLLTSMGIFGFLSKAHLDQAVPTGDVQAKLAILDEKIKTEKDNINDARKTISQLDRQVDETISRTAKQDNNAGVNRSINIRRSQQKERANLLKEIGDSQTKIAKLNEERAPIASEVRKVEAEVGPIKYIAALIYGDESSNDVNMLEKAVRIVTILIVIVFDPLAVLMLVAANWQLKRQQELVEKPVENPKPWDLFFNDKPSEDFPEREVVSNPNVIDDIVSSLTAEIKEPLEQTSESEIPEIEVDEHSKDWEPELYKRVEKKIEFDSAGRRITPLTEQELNRPAKTQSFLNKVQNVFTQRGAIEKDVEELQDKTK